MVGLALDSVRRKLYYTDEGDDAKIAELSTDGSHHRVVLRQAGMKPRGVVLHDDSRSVQPSTLFACCHRLYSIIQKHIAQFAPPTILEQ